MQFLQPLRRVCIFVILLWLSLSVSSLYGSPPLDATLFKSTPLDSALSDYVFADDPYFQWKIIQEIPFDHGIEYRLSMTSQRWQPESTSQHPVWRHDLSIYVPNKCTQTTALLFINGRNNSSRIKSSQYFASLATHTQSITAELYQVPNQPAVFKEDEEQIVRYEDSIVAYSWAQAIKNNDPTNIVLFPMVKSAHQAMNSIVEVAKKLDASSAPIKQFVLSGASKRGWTTWLTAAIDPRVIGIVPLVIDVLNIKPSMAHHKQAYQQYSSAIRDYVREGIMSALETGVADSTSKIIDPLTYKNALTMPKFIINASGDQFFLPDSSQFYLEQLLGENYFRRYKGALYLTADFNDVSAWQVNIDLHEHCTNIELPDNLGQLQLIVGQNEVSENRAPIINKQHSIIAPSKDQVITVRFEHNNPKCLPDYRQHSRSLKKVLQELDIPPWQRKRIPFLYFDDILVAVMGHFVCQPYLSQDSSPQGKELSITITWTS